MFSAVGIAFLHVGEDVKSSVDRDDLPSGVAGDITGEEVGLLLNEVKASDLSELLLGEFANPRQGDVLSFSPGAGKTQTQAVRKVLGSRK